MCLVPDFHLRQIRLPKYPDKNAVYLDRNEISLHQKCSFLTF
jgi:hypothetical protein